MKFAHRIVKNKKQTVEAIQYNVGNLNDVIRFVGSEKANWCPLSQELWINTHIGDCLVRDGYYIVKKQEVGYYPLAERFFHKIYVEEEMSEEDVRWTNIHKRYTKDDIK